MTRLSPQEESALRALAERVRTRFGARVQSILLFGSRARGTGRDDSDLDVLVQISNMGRSERRVLQDLAFDVGLEHGLVLSPLLADPVTWRTDLPLGRAIEREGVPL